MFALNKANIRVDKILTALVVKFRSNEFVGNTLLPEFGVKKESDKYRIFLPKGWFKGAPVKADGAITSMATPYYDEDSYTCYERAIKDLVTDRAIQNADLPVRPVNDTTMFLMEKVALSQEIDCFDLVIATLKAGGSTATLALTNGAAGTNWRGTSADPLSNIVQARRTIIRNIGKKPNKIFMTTDAHEALLSVSSIQDLLKYTTAANLTADNPLPSIRGIPITLADALVNIAAEDQTATYYPVLYDNASSTSYLNAIVAYVGPASDPVTFGKTFVSRSQRVTRWRGSEGEDREGEFVKVSKIYTHKITSVGAAFSITNVLGTSAN